jgi:putative DNA primase/helicase
MTNEKKRTKTDLSATGILRLAGDALTLFHTPAREPFASLRVKDHWENYRIKSPRFEDCLSAMCYHRYGAVPSHKALAEASSTLAGNALYANSEKQIHVRLAGHGGAIYLDLANDSWEAVRITGEGWEIVPHAPVKFVRAPGMQALPRPVDGGTIDDLRSFLNFANEDHWRLAVSWLVGSLRPNNPYPILILEGTHGSAKSTASRVLRALVDPNTAPLRGDPHNGRDLAISANNTWYLGFDNLSSVRPWLSDALCRLSTGGGFSTRALYTDGDEKIFDGTRPILLNGIDLGIERADLLDRAIILSLAPISEEGRQTEADLWTRFEAVRPSILGCLLDAVACALRRLPEIKLSKHPRMADFATWVCAAEPALGWPEGAFLEAYRRNLAEANALALEASPLVKPLMRIADRGPWEGTATQLQSTLKEDFLTIAVDEEWSCPESPRELSQDIRRLIPGLLKIGVIVDFRRTPGDNSERIISISKSGDGATQAPAEEFVEG